MTRRGGRPVLRIANCSGFFGDRVAAAREMVEGGPIDVLTGDWLAELTMYILHKTRQRSGGYARTFLRELEDVLPTCIERGHHRGLQRRRARTPRRLAAAVRELARRQGVEVHVASVSGDDITARLAELQAQGERVRQPRHRGAPARRRARGHGQRLPAGPARSPTRWRPAPRSS